eukprot:gnl/MRDRNA2_/MRDRNA2_46554_c0_seq1.p1 gnl/MRDRNA2_/MRDRNA2_46554_c0~~gnl/MRDRNA2_/MRDRNA2_46554_c0_seq1.p1  ORF type:complete len:229 (-),score=50.13 gnl/MRDRNA2_/MRDRNA2_46554_c0_seq1:8-694(-)
MKVVLIGDSSVGKSALVYRFIHNKVLTNSKATVGIHFFKQNIVDPDTNEEYTMQIWDTAGQEKFQSVTTHHYRATDGALLVFDISNESSFMNLDKWLAELRENTEPHVVVALVATKVDLSNQRRIHRERAQAYARANDLLYMETSSVWDKHEVGNGDGILQGVEGCMLHLLRGIVKQQRDLGNNPSRMDVSSFLESISGGNKGLRVSLDKKQLHDYHEGAASGGKCQC